MLGKWDTMTTPLWIAVCTRVQKVRTCIRHTGTDGIRLPLNTGADLPRGEEIDLTQIVSALVQCTAREWFSSSRTC